MLPSEAIDPLRSLVADARGIVETVKVAVRGGKSLGGENHYGTKFKDFVLRSQVAQQSVTEALSSAGVQQADLDSFAEVMKQVHDPKCQGATRGRANDQLSRLVELTLIPKCNSAEVDPTPKSEQVLPSALVAKAGIYYQKIVLQANGCYERGWYDACMVMVRKFFESLIIAVYERHNKVADIQQNGEFVLLKPMVDKIIAETVAWRLGRDTKPALKSIREDGNRAAHTRRFNLLKDDVDKLISGIRVAADDLLHLANLK